MVDQVSDMPSGPSDGRPPIVVLLVDDQQFIGTVVSQLLASESDIELHCCLHAADAVATANQINPTVIIQDLGMPDVDRLALVTLFKANPETAVTPVIVLYGNY